MTEWRQRVRAVARAPGEAGAVLDSAKPRLRLRPPGDAPATGPALLLPRRRPDLLGPVHVVQLLLVQVAVVAVLAALTRGAVVVAAAAPGAAALLLVTLGRRQGRWWLERQVMTRRYERRRKAGPDRYAQDARLVALRALAPGLTVDDVPAADGAQVGVARDDAGWFAVAAVTPSTPMRDDPGDRLPLDMLTAALADAGQPGAVLQVVRHTVPAPHLDVTAASFAGQSYRQLLAGFGAVPVPMDGVTWIAVRLDARSLAEAGLAAGTDLAGAPAVVAGLVRGVVKSLRRSGVAARVLDAADLVGALARSCDVEPPESGGTPPEPTEEWTRWHSSRLAHRSFWIRGWPPVEQSGALLDRLAHCPAAATDVALILAPEGDAALVDMRCLVRVTAPAAELDQACQTITDTALQAHADLFPLDGEQGPAVYASAPTGGGPR